MQAILKPLVIFSMFLLVSCFSPVKVKRECLYTLNTVPSCQCAKKPTCKTLIVLPIITAPPYNTALMAYTRRPFQVAYYVNTRWAATPSQMLLPLLVKTLQSAHYFHAVVMPPFVGEYEYVLTTTVLKLEHNFIPCRPEGVVMIRAQLSNALTNQVIATREFLAAEPIFRCPPYGGVIAQNKATAIVLSQISDFVVCNAIKGSPCK